MKNFFIALLFLPVINVSAQTIGKLDNVVNSSGYRFYYTGEIKDGKANGRGLATGITTPQKYFGNFVNGTFEGDGVLQQENGQIWAGTFANGEPSGRNVFINRDNDLTYGLWHNTDCRGRALVILKSNRVYIGDYNAALLNGRMITIDEEWNGISDYQYVDGRVNVHGYEYTLSSGKFLSGEFKNEYKTSSNLYGMQSFLDNPDLRAKSNEAGNLICTVLDDKELFNDTALVFDKKNGTRRFGRYSHGKFASGIGIDDDSLCFIADFDENGNRQGVCVYFNRGKSIIYGNFKDDNLDGKTIYVNLKDSKVFIGDLYGGFTGTGILLSGDNSFKMGSFRSGLLDGEGMTVNKDGVTEKGLYQNDKLVKNTGPASGSKVDMHPKDVCTAVNFLLKNYESEFKVINDGESFGSRGGAEDPFINSDDAALGSYYFFSGAVTNKVIPVSVGSLRHQTVFKSGIIVSKDFAVIKDRYDKLCNQLKNCSITSLNKTPLKLQGKITPLKVQASDDQLSFFTLPGYTGKARTVRIIISVTQYEAGYQLEMIINNKSDQGW